MRATQDGALPSLLERLTCAPSTEIEVRGMGIAQLRDAVRRDLGHLLNATHLASVLDLHSTSEVERSVLNFGIPDLAGRPASSIDRDDLANRIRSAILTFEPRVLEEGLNVRVLSSANGGPNAMGLEITGALWCQPVPVALRLRAELSLEDGEVHFSEAGG